MKKNNFIEEIKKIKEDEYKKNEKNIYKFFGLDILLTVLIFGISLYINSDFLISLCFGVLSFIGIPLIMIVFFTKRSKKLFEKMSFDNKELNQFNIKKITKEVYTNVNNEKEIHSRYIITDENNKTHFINNFKYNINIIESGEKNKISIFKRYFKPNEYIKKIPFSCKFIKKYNLEGDKIDFCNIYISQSLLFSLRERYKNFLLIKKKDVQCLGEQIKDVIDEIGVNKTLKELCLTSTLINENWIKREYEILKVK